MSEISLVRQDSLAKERFSRNEVQKEVHVVAKNLPFVLDVGAATINLHHAKIVAKLHYDSNNDTDFKQVDYVKKEPMTYRVFVDNTGTKATVEVRVMVLTSQHEDSLFRVKIFVTHNSDSWELISEPIRVVSKPSQVGKKRGGGHPISAGSPTSTAPSSPVAPPTPSHQVSTKKDAVLETLLRLEQQQREQRQIIEQLVKQQPPNNKRKIEEEFSSAFTNLVQSFKQLPAEERPHKLRKLIVNSSAEDQDALGQFIGLCTEVQPCTQTASVAELISNLDSLQQFLLPNQDDVSSSSPLTALEENNEAWNLIYNELISSPETL